MILVNENNFFPRSPAQPYLWEAYVYNVSVIFRQVAECREQPRRWKRDPSATEPRQPRQIQPENPMTNNNINKLYRDKKFSPTSAKSPAPALKQARDASATEARQKREKSAKNRCLKYFYMEYQQIS
jgi:hypothetical protein